MGRIAGLIRPGKPPDQIDPGAKLAGALGQRGSITEKIVLGLVQMFGWGRKGSGLARGPGFLAAFEGYIYNHRDLGVQGEHHSEIFLTLARTHGFPRVFELINGDFAAAFFNEATGELWLGRDRFGLKPLYYTQVGDRFYFASQPKALLTCPGVGRELNRQFVAVFAAGHYRAIDNQPEQSPYARIAQLPAGHWLRFQDGRLTTGRYWQLEDEPDFQDDPQTLAERYRELFLEAVKTRLEASDRPAFTLSGGLDSSSVLAAAAHLTGKKQPAFSAVYQDKTYDESQDIAPMLTLVDPWRAVDVDAPDVFGLIREMVAIHDEPVVTATWLSHFLLCREVARLGYGGLFGGLGGDELNAGEYEYFIFHFADLIAAGELASLNREIDLWARHHDHPIWHKDRKVAEAALARLTDPTRPGQCRVDAARLRRYWSTLNPDFFDLSSFMPVMDHPFGSYLKNRTYQDIFRETAPCCLRALDRHSTWFGLDNFLPFFDYRLVEFMFRVPGHLKIRDGVTKQLLRRAMSGLLPEETRGRIKKTGWNAPAHLWFTGRGRESLLDLVNSRSFRQRGIYDPAEVNRLIEEHQEIVAGDQPRENHMMFLWQLVNLELWLETVDDLGEE